MAGTPATGAIAARTPRARRAACRSRSAGRHAHPARRRRRLAPGPRAPMLRPPRPGSGRPAGTARRSGDSHPLPPGRNRPLREHNVRSRNGNRRRRHRSARHPWRRARIPGRSRPVSSGSSGSRRPARPRRRVQDGPTGPPRPRRRGSRAPPVAAVAGPRRPAPLPATPSVKAVGQMHRTRDAAIRARMAGGATRGSPPRRPASARRRPVPVRCRSRT